MKQSDFKILVIEDDPDVMAATSKLLSREGYRVFETQTGAQGIEKTQSIMPDLILLDVILPDIDGYEICRRLKSSAETSHIHTIIISGNKISSEDQSHGLEIGADDYIARPIQNREFLARINATARFIRAEKELHQYRATLEQRVEKRTVELKQEIGARKRIEKELLENQGYLNNVFNSTISGVFVVDPETRQIVDVNQSALESIGLPKDKVIGQTCHKFVCPAEQGKCPIADLGQVVDRSERTLLNLNNEEIPILKTVKTINRSDKTLYIESFLDISDVKQYESELENALKTIKTLRGIVPICSHCKKIRDDKGYWNSLELYLEQHSEASLSHGICPQCMEKIYGQEDWYVNMKKKDKNIIDK